MSLFDRFQSRETEQSGYTAELVGDDLATALTGAGPREAITVRPNEDNGGIPAMANVLESLHSVETESGLFRRGETNISPAHTFEIRYAREDPAGDRVVTLQYIAGDDRLDGTLERQLRNQYPESTLERRPSEALPGDADDLADHYVAAAELQLRRYTLLPIKNIDLPGFDTDPTGNILEEMVGARTPGEAGADCVVQVMFKPERREWIDGVEDAHGLADADDKRIRGAPGIRDLAANLREPTFERRRRLYTWETIEHPPSAVDKAVAGLLEKQQGEKGWRLCLRVFTISEDPDVAIKRTSHTAGMFRNFYENNAEQTFTPKPLSGHAVRELAAAAAARAWKETGIVKAQREVAGVVNIPRAEHVTTNKMQWSLSAPGEGIPPGTPRFDFDAAGIADGSTSDAAKQVAMLDASGADDPIWYGVGSTHGTEAGVFQDALYHQFVGGATRQGKTTLLTNFAAQCFRGPGSGLVVDPKGLDADEFLAEWPEERPIDDLVVMDLSDEFDRVPRFNFLEIPEYLEPGSRAHTSYVEALAEDILAMVAEAGGSDNYLGALMKRVVKTVVRGLARSGETTTLLDVAAVCASSDNLTRFRQQMDDERFSFLRDTAERLEERDDTDLEPLAGRMDEWVLNDNVRELICARDSSFSINDLVENGRWLVVRFDKASSETEVKMVGTALIRRTYFAQRHLRPSHTFDVICDEFDDIASTESNIHKILSEAAAFDYRCTLACQAPTNQLPERVQHAIENQCGTFLSFNPGGGKDAGWIAQQHTVENEDLLNLPRYRFYMRATTADNELTHSYQVTGFPPARDVRNDGNTRSDAEIRTLKESSLDIYGAPIETEDEQRAASPFIAGGEGATGTTLRVTDAVERAAAQAVYDAACRAGDADGYVSLKACAPAIRRRVSRLSETPVDTEDRLATEGDVFRRVLQHVDDDILAVRERDGETEYRARTPRATIATVGEDQSAGGSGHALLMWDAYTGLTWAGLDITINEASGTDADAVARPAPSDEQHAPELVDRLTGGGEVRLESEHETGKTKPGVSAQHCLQAANEGRRTIVLVRPDAEENVRDTIEREPAFCRSDHDVPGETRFFNSPRDLTIDGEPMTRPGGRENVWVRDDETGEIILRDETGTEFARFEGPAAVFSGRSPHLSGGKTTIKRPIIPEAILEADAIEPRAEIVVVPSGLNQQSPGALADVLVKSEPDTSDLDVPERAVDLLGILRERGEPFTTSEAHDVATEHGIDVSYRTVKRWADALESQGALQSGDYRNRSGVEYRPL